MGSWEVAAGYRSCEERCELSQRHPRRSLGRNLSRSHAANVDANVNVEFKVNKSVTGAPYSIKGYSLSHSRTLW